MSDYGVERNDETSVLRRKLDALRRDKAQMAAMAEIMKRLTGEVEPQDIAERLADALREVTGAARCFVFYEESGERELLAVTGPGPVAGRQEHRSWAIPLFARDTQVGEVVMEDLPTPERVPEYASVTETAVAYAAALIQNAYLRRKLENVNSRLRKAWAREHRIAEALQEDLRWSPPADGRLTGGLSVAAEYRPALDEAAVGGDLCDVFEMGDGKYHVVMADVSGKGLSAASQTAFVKYHLRAYASILGDPAAVLSRLNDAFCRWAEHDRFVTLFYGVVDAECKRLTYANAGHEPPLLVCGGTELGVRLGPTGPALGIEEQMQFAAECVALPEGSRLLLVTDGVTDAHRPGGELLGTAGLLRLMMDRSKSPREVLDGALAMVAEHAGDGPADDIAMLFLEVCAAKARSDVRAVFDSHPKPCLLR